MSCQVNHSVLTRPFLLLYYFKLPSRARTGIFIRYMYILFMWSDRLIKPVSRCVTMNRTRGCSSSFFLNAVIFIAVFSTFLTSVTECSDNEDDTNKSEKLLIVTVATEETDGYLRFKRSADVYGLSVKVLGMGEQWNGGDMASIGGGHKINILRKYITKFRDRNDLVIMFVDSYDVIFTANQEEILESFYEMKSQVVFSAESFCWPDLTLADQYPKGENGNNKYLNSGGFIGYAREMVNIVTSSNIGDQDDDQLFYTKVFLNEDLRETWSIKLDHRSRIFQNLHGSVRDMDVLFKENDSLLKNLPHNTLPHAIHGNGLTKVALNSFGNYLAKSWTITDGCITCKDDTISLKDVKDDDLPSMVLSIFIARPSPFIPEFFERISELNYPKNKLDVFLYDGEPFHSKVVEKFVDEYKSQYKSMKVLNKTEAGGNGDARNRGIDLCRSKKCDYYFSVDSDAMLTNVNVLRILIEQNRKVIAPLLVRPFKVWSNFWGALSAEGFYARSFDYMEIVKDDNPRRGVWNVPYISCAYLINGSLINSPALDELQFNQEDVEPDMSFPMFLRDKGIFMYVTNMRKFGYLTDGDSYDTSKVHPELYQIFDNRLDWEKRYIHENFSKLLGSEELPEEPCPDVYWFPVMTETFCDHIIEELETFGKWSSGTNDDPRLANGYENVPTRDIHMSQVGFDKHWLHFLNEFIRPMQEKIYPGYIHDPPHALLNFVVRYRPDEQAALRPHHDTSTYTINVALNKPGIDFQGGGCRFVRYNCSITQTRKGWTFIHPGRLTHYHEGLRTTAGTRYIFVSFVDP